MDNSSSLLNWILWMPMIGVLGVLLFPKEKEREIRWWSLLNTAITFLLTLCLYVHFDSSVSGMQQSFTVKYPWIPQFNIFYHLGVDGISLPMVILTALLFMLCILSSWTVSKRVKSYFALFLFLQSTVFGVFLALDFFLFYVYWEVMLIPMFFLIGVWGGENREYAAVKFFLYTFFGSILMLVGMVALYYASGKGVDSFSLLALQGGHFGDIQARTLWHGRVFRQVVFLVHVYCFAIKVPIFPFHTWLPHAHVQAPTAISVILAGVLLKMGTYGFLRIAYPIFPQAAVEYSHVYSLARVDQCYLWCPLCHGSI